MTKARLQDTALGVALLLLAAFFRLYRLGNVPPGMFVDVAYNGLDAQNVLGGHFPLYFSHNNGREPLFIYLQAALASLGGLHPITLVFASVAVGLLGIAATYRLFRELFGLPLAAIATCLLSTSLWFVAINRIGLRSNALPLFAAATVFLLWRLLKVGAWPAAVLGGLVLGLSQYTYTAARLLPFMCVACCVVDARRARKRLPQLACMALLALLVFLPELVYFGLHSSEVLLRFEQISALQQNPSRHAATPPLLHTLGLFAAMFFIRGDPSALQNIPLRPIFGPPLAAFFLLGAALVLVRARKWLAYRWLLLWFLFMSVPGAVTIDTPNTLRVLSLAPAVFMVASVGLYTVAVQIRPPFLRTGTLLLVLIFTTVHDFRSYFGTWAHDPATYYASSTPSLKAAPFLQAHASQTMFIADEASAPIRLLAPATRAAGWLPVEAAAIPIPSDLTTRGVLYAGTDNSILVRLAPLWLPGIQVLPHTVGPDGRPDLLAFLWPAPAVAHFRSNQKRVVYGGARDYQVASYQLAQAAGNVDLRVLWRPLSPSGPYDLYVHLINSAARQVAQADYLVWPVVHLQGAEQLLEGTPSTDELLTESTFKLPAGDYAALLGVARRSRRDRAKIVGGRLGPELRIPITV